MHTPLLLTIFLLFLSGCKTSSGSHVDSVLLEEIEKFALMQIIHNPEIKICVATTDFGRPNGKILEIARIEEIKTLLVRSLTIWKKAIDDFATLSTFSKITFLSPDDGCKPLQKDDYPNDRISDLSLTIVNNDDARLAVASVKPHLPGKIQMLVWSDVDFVTLLHETGHVFGLGDVYQLDGKHPVALMNAEMMSGYRSNGNLYSDDVNGIKYAYCRVFFMKELEICKKLNPAGIYGPFPNYNTELKPLFTIGGNFKDSQRKDRSSIEGTSPCAELVDIEENGPLDLASVKIGDCFLAPLSNFTLRDTSKQVTAILNMVLLTKGKNLTLARFTDDSGDTISTYLKLKQIGSPIYPDLDKPPYPTKEMYDTDNESVEYWHGYIINKVATPKVGDVIIAKSDLKLQLVSQASKNIPERTTMTVLDIASEGLVVDYFDLRGSIDASLVDVVIVGP